MIDIARDVVARTTVDGPLRINPEEVFAISFFDFGIRDQWPEIFDDSFSLGYGLECDQSQARSCSLHFEVHIQFRHKDSSSNSSGSDPGFVSFARVVCSGGASAESNRTARVRSFGKAQTAVDDHQGGPMVFVTPLGECQHG